jgi:hypothetical protein
MKKSRSKSKVPAEAPAEAPATKSSNKTKPVDLAEVRKDITNIVGNEATKLAQAVIEEARKGQLAPVKYLFEVAGLYPASTETGSVKPEENSLARTLIQRLGLPEDVLISPEEDDSAVESMPLSDKNSVPRESGEDDSGGDESRTAGEEVAG